jgi:hypothetical protein
MALRPWLAGRSTSMTGASPFRRARGHVPRRGYLKRTRVRNYILLHQQRPPSVRLSSPARQLLYALSLLAMLHIFIQALVAVGWVVSSMYDASAQLAALAVGRVSASSSLSLAIQVTVFGGLAIFVNELANGDVSDSLSHLSGILPAEIFKGSTSVARTATTSVSIVRPKETSLIQFGPSPSSLSVFEAIPLAEAPLVFSVPQPELVSADEEPVNFEAVQASATFTRPRPSGDAKANGTLFIVSSLKPVLETKAAAVAVIVMCYFVILVRLGSISRLPSLKRSSTSARSLSSQEISGMIRRNRGHSHSATRLRILSYRLPKRNRNSLRTTGTGTHLFSPVRTSTSFSNTASWTTSSSIASASNSRTTRTSRLRSYSRHTRTLSISASASWPS